MPQVVEAEEKLAKDKDKKNMEVDKEKNQLMYSLELPEEYFIIIFLYAQLVKK